MRRVLLAATLSATIVLAGCGAGDGGTGGGGGESSSAASSASVAPSPAEGQVIASTIPAPSLAGNLLGDPAERSIIVYLPPSYEGSDQRYPVVYFLAGADESVGRLKPFSGPMWDEMARTGTEMILVEADGRNALGANFYANSPVGGNAEDVVADDLVAYVDQTYRTLADRSSRGLSGFSMGGSGTVNVGLRHPDVYAALYACSPGLLAEDGGLEAFLRSNGAWRAYGAAFAPDVTVPSPFMRPIDAHAPLDGQDPAVVAAWESGFGNLRQKIADYLGQTQRLEEIRVVYGTHDSYPWIPVGSDYFLGLLEENGVPHSSQTFNGGHTLDSAGFAADYISFFSEHLKG